MEKTNGHLFSDEKQSQAYKANRPAYSDDVFNAIYDYAATPKVDCAVDIATGPSSSPPCWSALTTLPMHSLRLQLTKCFDLSMFTVPITSKLHAGTGQIALALVKRYSRVIGLDASPTQITEARTDPLADGERLSFAVSPAEATGLPDSSADLVTCATALHWCVHAAICRVPSDQPSYGIAPTASPLHRDCDFALRRTAANLCVHWVLVRMSRVSASASPAGAIVGHSM